MLKKILGAIAIAAIATTALPALADIDDFEAEKVWEELSATSPAPAGTSSASGSGASATATSGDETVSDDFPSDNVSY